MNQDHARRPAPPLRASKPLPLLRTHKRAFFLIGFYIVILLIPWVITAIFSRRPLTLPSWTFAPGIMYTDYKDMKAWARAIPVLNAIAAVSAIPVISAVVAQAVVVFTQRRYDGQALSVRQLFRLADRAWGRPGLVWEMLRWDEPGHARVNWFLIACMGLLGLGAVQIPLYQLLAPWEEIRMPTCVDTGFVDYGVGRTRCDFDSIKFKELRYTKVGIDLEPAQMAVISQQFILPRMRNDLATVESRGLQANIWKTPLQYGDTSVDYDGLRGFVAALPGGTTTGVLREHIMRLNSTVSCDIIDASEFPSTCSGANPFQASFDYKNAYDWGSSSNTSTIDVCAPGDVGKHPWTVSRNRQELSEEVFLRFSGDASDDTGALLCTGLTTRGYFELGNIHNGGAFGDLLEKWPSNGHRLADFQYNDYMATEYIFSSKDQVGYLPSESDTYLGSASPVLDPRDWSDYANAAPSNTYSNMTGPLMTSVLALFDSSSWTHQLYNLTSNRSEDESTLRTTYSTTPALLSSLCASRPFARLNSQIGSSYSDANCATSLYTAMQGYTNAMRGWKSNETATARLEIAMFLANRAALTSHTAGVLPWLSSTGREIYTAPGIRVRKPSVSLPSLIILSIFVAAQVTALLYLALWLVRFPTWTRTLDALALARLASSLDPGLLPPLRTTGEKDWDALSRVDGLVGAHARRVVERRDDDGGVLGAGRGDAESEIEMRALSVASTVGKEPEGEVSVVGAVELGLGAPGVVARRGRETGDV